MPDLNQTIADTVFRYSDLFVLGVFLYALLQIYCAVRFKWISMGTPVDEKKEPGMFVIALLFWMACGLIAGVFVVCLLFIRLAELVA